jgi:peptidyl-prolyl cis-trans isomerase B (cyclophilin B)
VSQRRPQSRRPLPVDADELEGGAPRGRQALVALLVMAVLIAAVVASGLLINKALETPTKALANCATSTQISAHQFIGPQPMCITASQRLEATITSSQGAIVIQLHPEIAPVTVNNFVVLAAHGYYTGLQFWKSEDWVVQAGDPLNNGRGGPGYNLPDEPSAATWQLGAVGMARVPGGPVNGSQFFIMKAAWPGSGPTAVYNRFGTVTTGMDKVQAISGSDTITSITIKVS